MSKIGNHRVDLQGSRDYGFGWRSAERGEPFPQWAEDQAENCSLSEQRLGWQDYHSQEQSQ